MMRYVIKQGEYLDYPEDWDSLAFVNSNKKGPTKMDTIASNIMEGKYKNRLDVAKDGNGGAAIIYGKHIDEFINMVEDENEHSRTLSIQWIELKPTMEWGKEWCQIIIWLNLYIRKPENVKGKIKHFYICGKRNLGKITRLLDALKERLNIYYINKDELQNLCWKSNFFDLCILDDYDGNKTITWMNEFLGNLFCTTTTTTTTSYTTTSYTTTSYTTTTYTTYTGSKYMKICIPGGTHSRKTEMIATIVISNISLEKCYEKHIKQYGRDERYLAVEDGFCIIDLDERGNFK